MVRVAAPAGLGNGGAGGGDSGAVQSRSNSAVCSCPAAALADATSASALCWGCAVRAAPPQTAPNPTTQTDEIFLHTLLATKNIKLAQQQGGKNGHRDRESKERTHVRDLKGFYRDASQSTTLKAAACSTTRLIELRAFVPSVLKGITT